MKRASAAPLYPRNMKKSARKAGTVKIRTAGTTHARPTRGATETTVPHGKLRRCPRQSEEHDIRDLLNHAAAPLLRERHARRQAPGGNLRKLGRIARDLHRGTDGLVFWCFHTISKVFPSSSQPLLGMIERYCC